jgi:putative Mg2+ transporter-C (MgtC) family protein
MDATFQAIALHLLYAVGAGGIIGLERSYHARPAGFRTHTLVCLASSLLMLITLYQAQWLPGSEGEAYRTDPTRMAQGIMTGIGFLGAGVIFKEGLSVRGLTTAASIWMTAAIGILIGIGFYYPAGLATVLTLTVLSVFRWIEGKIPTHTYAQHHLSFDRQHVLPEADLRALLHEHGFNVANLSYRTSDDGARFEYRMVLRTSDLRNISRLSVSLREMPQVRSFRISPTGD